MLESFTPGESVILKKNPNFFLAGYPKLDEIIIRVIKDKNSLLIALEMLSPLPRFCTSVRKPAACTK